MQMKFSTRRETHILETLKKNKNSIEISNLKLSFAVMTSKRNMETSFKIIIQFFLET